MGKRKLPEGHSRMTFINLFVPKAPFLPPENIRKPYDFFIIFLRGR